MSEIPTVSIYTDSECAPAERAGRIGQVLPWLMAQLDWQGLAVGRDITTAYQRRTDPAQFFERIAIHREFQRTHQKELDTTLQEKFAQWVEQVGLRDLVAIDNPKIPKGLDRFRLMPIGKPTLGMTTDSTPGRHFVCTDSDVRFMDTKEGVRPYLDTGLAIGLVYNNELAALAGACIDKETGALQIKQLQGVTFKAGDPSTKYQSGLYNGFGWRIVLCRAWEEIAIQLGVPTVEIQSNENNRWEKVRDQLHLYDDVAMQLGYTFDDDPTFNWVKETGIVLDPYGPPFVGPNGQI